MPEPDTPDAILAAARTALARHGVERVTLEDVARDAGVTRQTVYRHFGSRRGLLAAVMATEIERFLECMKTVGAEACDLLSGIEAAIGFTLDFMAESEIFQRLLETDLENLLVYLARESGPVLRATRDTLVALVVADYPDLAGPRLERHADLVVRLMLSYGVTPSRVPHRQLAAELADLLCHGLLRELH